MLFILLHNQAILPTQAYQDDAGYDLYTPFDFDLGPHGSTTSFRKVETGVSWEALFGVVGLVMPRSSLNARQIHTALGVVDAGYRGDIAVTLQNLSDKTVEFRQGDRIAQLVVVPLAPFGFSNPGLAGNEKPLRGSKGFGSSGS